MTSEYINCSMVDCNIISSLSPPPEYFLILLCVFAFLGWIYIIFDEIRKSKSKKFLE